MSPVIEKDGQLYPDASGDGQTYDHDQWYCLASARNWGWGRHVSEASYFQSSWAIGTVFCESPKIATATWFGLKVTNLRQENVVGKFVELWAWLPTQVRLTGLQWPIWRQNTSYLYYFSDRWGILSWPVSIKTYRVLSQFIPFKRGYCSSYCRVVSGPAAQDLDCSSSAAESFKLPSRTAVVRGLV